MGKEDKQIKKDYYECPKCKIKDNYYDYDKANDVFYIRCKKCKQVLHKQDLKVKTNKAFNFKLDKKFFMVLVFIIGVIVLALFLGLIFTNVYDGYSNLINTYETNLI